MNSKFNRAVGIMFPAIFGLLGVLFVVSAMRFISLFDTALRMGIGIALLFLALAIRREARKEIENDRYIS